MDKSKLNFLKKKKSINQTNYNKRLNFYLGVNLVNQTNVDITNHTNTITINDFNNNSKNYIEIYHTPFKNLLIKTNNNNKKFIVCFGDVTHTCDYITLVKNRCADNNDSVILRCLEFNRHWGNYYNKPNDILFEKKINKIFWRGTTTGQQDRKGNRFDLIEKWFNKNNNIDVGFSFICQGKDDYSKYVKGTCDIKEFLKYKYIISVEGNDKDSGLNWKLNSNSLILMQKPLVTSWLMETTLIPNFHYVLLNDDFSDLEEKFNWCNNNQDKCKEIIKNANDYMQQFSDNKMEEQLEEDVINEYFKKLN